MHLVRAYLHRSVPTLADADREALAGAVRPRQLACGQAGDYRPELAPVLHGACRLYYLQPDGEELITCFFFENHLLADYPGCLLGRAGHLSAARPGYAGLPDGPESRSDQLQPTAPQGRGPAVGGAG